MAEWTLGKRTGRERLIVGRSTIGVPGQIKFEGNIVDTSKPKPDLMRASPASTGGGKRILAHLEHGAKTAAKPARPSKAGWTIDGWTVGLVFLLIFISSVAWLVREETIPESSALKHGTSETRTQVAAARRGETQPEASAAEPAKQSAGVSGQEEASGHAAAIINDAPAHGAATATAQPSTALTSIAAQPITASMPSSTSATPLITQAARRQPGATGTNHNTARAPAASAAAASGARAPGDTDVALLTALVAHANKSSIVTPERSRDIVERQETDSTVELLARCKQLGLIEGMLCRSRICSGRWEADAACRAPAH